MSVQQIESVTRRARKEHRCGLCWAVINPGDLHRVEKNVFDGRIYNFRDCAACDRDGVIAIVASWTGDYYDEGVTAEQAMEWAEDTAWGWPNVYSTSGLPRRRVSADERRAARSWLARAAGGEGE